MVRPEGYPSVSLFCCKERAVLRASRLWKTGGLPFGRGQKRNNAKLRSKKYVLNELVSDTIVVSRSIQLCFTE